MTLKKVELLHPHHLFYEALGEPSIKDTKTVENPVTCHLCGMQTNETIHWKIPPTFTDLDIFVEKDGFQTLCPACVFALSHIKELHKLYILTLKTGYNVIQFDDQADKKVALGGVKIVSRYYLKEFLLDPPIDDPWVMMFQSKMNPQHSLMKATVNYGDGDSLFISEGGKTFVIPRRGLKELLEALEKIKLSTSLYPYLFTDAQPNNKHKEIDLWKEVFPIISQHRHKHYLDFIYDRIIPPKKYMLDHNKD